MDAILDGDLDAAQLSLIKGAAIHAETSKEKQPIHFAAEQGHLHIIQWLVQQDAHIIDVSDNKVNSLYIMLQKKAIAK